MLALWKNLHTELDVPELMRGHMKPVGSECSGSAETPSHRESMSASSFFSPEIWLHSKLVPVIELHMESLRTKTLSGNLDV